ncbi:MAG TPA: class I SAM-dependent methyltransferase [Thermoleophilaceae bacterium]|nr:class I SAM-dependent methyltransferase [Thermoleophilaceae bacterium]
MEEPDVNRAYFLHYVEGAVEPGSVVLDFGCGSGTMVRILREAGFDAYGVDIRWPGADYGELGTTGPGEGVLRCYEEGGRLPFADDAFDLVISDQVFEHVVPIEATVGEIERVLRPGGVSYHHFPSRAVWREGHIGIPFAHRLPPGAARLAYTAALRRLGLGIFKDDRPAREWAAEKLRWIDDWTVYRPASEIHAIFGRRARLRNREIDYCRFRAGDRRVLRALLNRPLMRGPAEALFRRLAFEAIEARPDRGSERPAVPAGPAQ